MDDLGMASINELTAMYANLPIGHAYGENFIRVLKIEPADSISAPPRTTLAVISTGGKGDPYQYLSYAWESNIKTETIVCYGHDVPITANLDADLRRIRARQTYQPANFTEQLEIWICQCPSTHLGSGARALISMICVAATTDWRARPCWTRHASHCLSVSTCMGSKEYTSYDHLVPNDRRTRRKLRMLDALVPGVADESTMTIKPVELLSGLNAAPCCPPCENIRLISFLNYR